MSPPLKLAVAPALSLATITLGACGSDSGADGATSSQPQIPPRATNIDRSNFVRRVDNPYFPLKPGATYRHRGVKEGNRAVDVFAVTHRTRKVLGVANTLVDDKLYVAGRLEEIAHDWYAQDREGNVWYFGETIKEFNPKGKRIPAQGAWEAGVGGARPGIVMPAQPKVGDTPPRVLQGDGGGRLPNPRPLGQGHRSRRLVHQCARDERALAARAGRPRAEVPRPRTRPDQGVRRQGPSRDARPRVRDPGALSARLEDSLPLT
jgi:hypothetical protein